MSSQKTMVKNINTIVQSLEQLNSQIGTEYILVAKGTNYDSKYEIYKSSGFNKGKLIQLTSVIENGTLKAEDRPCEIKPALKQCYSLEISKRSTLQLFDQYYDLMSSLSQAVCKTIAKEWIKVAEPKKQALYPYKFYNASKPPWWPARVNHIEPDHLDKDSRINVLINILRNPSFDIESLKIRTSVLEFKYPITFSILNEIYYLAIYDRLFFGQGRENETQAGLLAQLDPLERDKIMFDKIGIMVSDIRGASAGIRHRGLIMVRQIRESWLNHDVYLLNMLPILRSLDYEEEISILNSEEGTRGSGSPEDKEPLMLESRSRKRRASQVSENEEPDEQEFANNKMLIKEEKEDNVSENDREDLSVPIHLKQEHDYLDDYREFDYETVSQEIVHNLDSAMENYSSSPSSSDFYISSTFDKA